MCLLDPKQDEICYTKQHLYHIENSSLPTTLPNNMSSEEPIYLPTPVPSDSPSVQMPILPYTIPYKLPPEKHISFPPPVTSGYPSVSPIQEPFKFAITNAT